MNQTQDGLDVLTATNQCQRAVAAGLPESPAATLQRSDPQTFSRVKVSISAAYGEDDGRTEWQVTDEQDGYVHIGLYELRYIGPPFNHDSRIQVLSLMVTREQKEALLCELRDKQVECER